MVVTDHQYYLSTFVPVDWPALWTAEGYIVFHSSQFFMFGD